MNIDKVRKLRVEHKKTQLELAQILGLKTASAYNKKEKGNVPFTLEDVRKLSDFYGVDVEEFIVSTNQTVKQ